MDEPSGDEGKSTQSVKRSSETLDSSISQVIPQATPQATPQDIPYGRVRDLGNGVYAGAGFAESGETIYFGMQRITEDNEADITKFAEVTKWMGSEHRGRIGAVGRSRRQDSISPNYNSAGELYGYSLEELTVFVQRIQKNELVNRVHALGGEVVGNHMKTRIGDGISYISKEPITGPRSFLKEYYSSKTVKSYFEDTKDLIMMVGCSFSKKQIHNRGIGRSLAAFYLHNNKFKGVSMPLHGFTCAVAEVIDPETETFLAFPMEKMADIICGEFADCVKGIACGEPRIEIAIDDMSALYKKTAAGKLDSMEVI